MQHRSQFATKLAASPDATLATLTLNGYQAWANGYTAKDFESPMGEWELNRDAVRFVENPS